jgi:farnesyl diphosphate synthase
MPSSADKRQRFISLWEPIKHTLLQALQDENIPQAAVEWYERNLDYNVPGGKLNRGLSVPDTLSVLLGRPLTDEEYEKAGVLGWCIELLQAFFLVADDVMDGSITRRGQECWYRKEGVGESRSLKSYIRSVLTIFLHNRHDLVQRQFPATIWHLPFAESSFPQGILLC